MPRVVTVPAHPALGRRTRSPPPATCSSRVARRSPAATASHDPDARRALLDECWAEDGVYRDPSGRAAGRDGLCAHIGSFREQRPGTRTEVISRVDEHDGYLRFGWQMLGADGTVALEGTDIGELDSAGALRRIIGFFGPLPPRRPVR